MEAEIARLGEGGATSADNMLLKNLLDDATKAKDKLEHDYLQSHTEKLILESQLASLRGGGPLAEGYEKLSSTYCEFVDSLTIVGLEGPMSFFICDKTSWIKKRSLSVLRRSCLRLLRSSQLLRENLLLLNLIVGRRLCP